jgi:hypothetical protein
MIGAMNTLVTWIRALWTLLHPAGTTPLHSAAADQPPRRSGRVGIPSRAAMRRSALHVYVVALLIANALLVYIGGELVDLYISSVELWAELARKHLELTL